MAYLSFAGHSPALPYGVKHLKEKFTFLPLYDPTVTHLLLPVPSMDPNGLVKGGVDLGRLLSELPRSVTVIGGNLPQWVSETHPVLDLLKDPLYMASNANITAHCALKHILIHSPYIVPDCQIAILGWGRIGKCLARLLKNMGAAVTVYARKESDRALASGLGFRTSATAEGATKDAQIILNTVPVMILPEPPEGALKIDLASQPGIGGGDVLWARFLPGKDAPASSGKLIADTVSRLIEEETP